MIKKHNKLQQIVCNLVTVLLVSTCGWRDWIHFGEVIIGVELPFVD